LNVVQVMNANVELLVTDQQLSAFETNLS